MENQLNLYINVKDHIWNPNIMKGEYVELFIDEVCCGKATGSKTLLVENGIHTLRAVCYWESWSSPVELEPVQFKMDNNNEDITINIYNVLTYDIAVGIVPLNPNKQINYGKKGCYVATCVYGSYDCPEVWTLRRFRDDTLGATWYGRLFIYTYYAISPTLVKWFGHTKWFKKMWKGTLDQMVSNLRAKGIEDTPYNDKNW